MVSTTHPQAPVMSFALEEDARGPGLSVVNTLSGGRCSLLFAQTHPRLRCTLDGWARHHQFHAESRKVSGC